MALDTSSINIAQSLFDNAMGLMKSSVTSGAASQDPVVSAAFNMMEGAVDPLKSAFDLLCQTTTELIQEVNQLRTS